MIHCFPFHQKAWDMRAGGRAVHYSLFIITIRIRAPATLTTFAKATVIRAGILIHYNEQNLEIVETMRAGNGKQLIILEWPYSKEVTS